MTDILERMLAADWPGKYVDETMKEAATEIRRLREEIENRPIGWGAFCDENEALRQQVRELKEAVAKPFLTVFLDGRNEYGSHALPMPPENLGATHAEVEKCLADQGDGLSEKIISDAEALGFEIGHSVTTSWRFVDSGEFTGGYMEYEGISPPLTELFCGTAKEQREALAKLGGEDAGGR
jgi:hypothetical protein